MKFHILFFAIFSSLAFLMCLFRYTVILFCCLFTLVFFFHCASKLFSLAAIKIPGLCNVSTNLCKCWTNFDSNKIMRAQKPIYLACGGDDSFFVCIVWSFACKLYYHFIFVNVFVFVCARVRSWHFYFHVGMPIIRTRVNWWQCHCKYGTHYSKIGRKSRKKIVMSANNNAKW